MPDYILEKCTCDKKFKITTPKGKVIKFGDKNYEDYTMHKDKERKKLYIGRHKKNEKWTDKNTAAFWSRWLLWNKLTLQESIKNVESRFHIKIKF
jgi:hypothetical protein